MGIITFTLLGALIALIVRHKKGGKKMRLKHKLGFGLFGGWYALVKAGKYIGPMIVFGAAATLLAKLDVLSVEMVAAAAIFFVCYLLNDILGMDRFYRRLEKRVTHPMPKDLFETLKEFNENAVQLQGSVRAIHRMVGEKTAPKNEA